MGIRKRPFVYLVILATVAAIIVSKNYGQETGTPESQVNSRKGPKKQTNLTNTTGETTFVLITPEGPQEQTKITVSSNPRVIIKLKDAPLGRFIKQSDGDDKDQHIKGHHEKIRRHQDQVKSFIQKSAPGHNGQFKEYVYAFNGLATRLTDNMIESLKSHPLVEAVYTDVEVEASLTDSVPLIGANTLWTSYGATGTGIRVAVIDTGVDYRHPDLGGGLGASYKVIGGYDFVNNDSDPLDDNGHGTHVAGIIGANGTVKGVAPDAKILAYKVLGAGGTGLESDIIAAIERALDPDQNPATSDGAHVLSMSLGGPGTPDDPVSQAVDDAVLSGAICVVAGGNYGPGYFTLTSPGVARQAITVGASDKSDAMASFSSRGPARGTWAIKPDVVAPGASIYSTYLNNGYATISGTSMATPHVAGLVALLRQLHPTWTAEEIKGVLIQQAKSLNADSFTQGGGRVQAVDSHNAQAVITPGSVSFGLDDPSVSVWTKSETLRIKNLTGGSSTYTFSVQGSFPSGVTWTITPSSVTLGPNAFQDVTFTLNVDNSSVPNSTSASSAYEGKLVATSSTETLTVPFAFLKATHLQLTFDVGPLYVWVHNRIASPYSGNFSYWATDPGTSLTVLVRPNYAYDIVVGYTNDPSGAYNPQTRVVREKVAVGTGNIALSISRNEAAHQMTLRALDVNAQEVSWNGLYGGTGTWGADSFLLSKFYNNLSTFAPYGIVSAGDVPRNVLYFPTLSSDYKFNLDVIGLSQQTNWAYYDFKYTLSSGVTQSQTLSNSTQFKHMTHHHTVPAGVSKVFLVPGIGHADWWYPVAFWRYDSISMADVFTPPSADVLTAPFVREAYYPTATGFWSRHNQFLYQYNGTLFGDGDDPILYQTAWFGAPDTTTLDGFRSLYQALMSNQDPAENYFSITGNEMTHNLGPHKWDGRAYSEADQRTLRIYPAFGWAGMHFYWSQFGDVNWARLNYDIYQGATRITGGTIDPLFTTDLTTTLPAPGIYTVKVPYNGFYSVNGKSVNASSSMTVDTTKSETDTPELSDLKIFSNGVQTDTTNRANATNQIRVAFDDMGYNITQASVSYSASNRWVSLGSFSAVGVYTVNVPTDMLTGHYNLKVSATDSSGNSMAYEMTPGFYHKGIDSRLSNISTRGYVGTGSNVMIGGFVINGQEPRTVLIRARGPSLVDVGLTGVLTDPYLKLYSGGTVIARNDNWQTNDPLQLSPIIWKGTATDIQATGLKPTGTNSTRESVLLVTLPPGAYTSIVTGVNSGVGIGMIEVFEVASYPSSSRLTNISTRDYVGTGNNVMIGGFTISGTASKKVLIRAKGPSLADVGLTGVLADPYLKLYSGSTVVARNDNWQTDDPLQLPPIIWKGTVSDIQATGLQPSGTNSYRESVLLVTLPPGAYTCIVNGVSSGVGIGMVEVFEIAN